MNFKEKLEKEIKKQLNQEISLRIPPSPEFGDFSLALFNQDLSKIKLKSNLIEKTEIKGGYLNIFIKKSRFIEETLKEINKDYGKTKSKQQKILIEYPSPNTNKPLHLGHIRNILLGSTLTNLLKFQGNKVIQVNLNNDRGIHICKSMLAYKLWGNNKQPDKKSDHFIGDFYVMFAQRAKENKQLETQAQELLLKWEQGDKETISLWKKMNNWALKGFNETYKKLDLKFDKEYYESSIYKEGKKIIEEGLKKGLFTKDEENNIIIDLTKEGLGKKVLLRQDGTSIYITQDIYLAYLKEKEFHSDKSVYVVASEQDYHFKVLFKILDILNIVPINKLYHFSYGMIELPTGKMKSREGNVVDADDIINEVIILSKKVIKEKNSKIKEIDRLSKVIGIGALRFFILKYDAKRNFVYNPEESLSFEGETGPYVQYTHARICSILKKSKFSSKIDYSRFNDQEFQLIKKMAEFPEVIKDSTLNYRPHVLCNYLIKLAQLFNNYYSKNEIKSSKERLLLASKTKQILFTGLALLGIEAPEFM